MAGRRKLEIEIASAAKGDGFKKSEGEATKWSKHLGEAGEKAGKNLSSGVESGSAGLGDKLKSGGAKASEMFKGAMLAGGALAGAALVAGLMSHLETEVATDKLAAQLGGSEWAQGMGEVAGDLYVSGFGESVSDTASTLKQVLQQGLLPEDATNAQIEALTGKVLTFADVMDQDVTTSIASVGTMLKTDIAQDGTQALDILTAGASQGADKMGDLVEVFGEYSTNFRQLGLDGTQAMGLIVQAVDGGAYSADQAADSLREFSVRAVDGSETSAQAFKDLGLDAGDMAAKIAAGGPQAAEGLDQVLDGLRGIEDPLKRNATATALFGSMSEDMAGALMGMDLDTAAQSLGNVAGRTEDLGSAYDNASSKIETFKREAMEKLTTFIGNTVLPKLGELQTWAEENPVAFKIVAGVVGGVLVVAFAAWAVSAAAAAVATIAATWPILLIGAAVIGLAALVVIHFDTIKRWISNAFNWVKDNWPLLLGILTGPFGWAAIAISKNWQTIKDGVTGAKNWIVDKWNAVVGFVTGLPGRIGSAAVGMWNGILNGAHSAIRTAVGLINNLIEAFNRLPGPNVPTVGVPGGGRNIAAGSGGGGRSTGPVRAMASGGIVRHRPGGILANIGEGRHDEAVVPLDGRNGLGSTIIINLTNHGVLGSSHEVTEWLHQAVSTGIANGQINDRGRRL